MSDTIRITFDGDNAGEVMKLFGRMQNRDGDVSVWLFHHDDELGWVLWDEGEMAWNRVEIGDVLVSSGTAWTSDWGSVPVTKVIHPIAAEVRLKMLEEGLRAALVDSADFDERSDDYYAALARAQETLRKLVV